jgi:SAM-dependent methyltransferase
MSFEVAGEKYERFMGRYVKSLAPVFADAAGIEGGMRVLDVGCGPGGLTRDLVARTGADNVAAIDPSAPFVEACRANNPGADVREGPGEQLPWEDDAFDAALASLVVGFMRDPHLGVLEMARVTKPGGTVAACFWDTAGGMEMLRIFWQSAAAVDPTVTGERRLMGAREGDLRDLLTLAGLQDVRDGELTATARYESFDDLWEPATFGVGPFGEHVKSLSDEDREAVREEVRRRVDNPDGPFELSARAWFARGTVPE